MSKLSRLIALAVCCVMLLALLVSCGETEVDKSREYLINNPEPAKTEYVTLNLYIPCNFEVTDTINGQEVIKPEAKNVITSMQNEFNRVIEPKYNTRVVFKFVEADKYTAIIDAQRQIAFDNLNTVLKKEPTSVTDVYPKEETFQMDIFVATGSSMVNQFAAQNMLADLTAQLGKDRYVEFCNQNDPTKSSLSIEMYENAVLNGTRVGVPANFLIGSYSYYFVNLELVEGLNFNPNPDNVENAIEDLRNRIKKANEDITAGHLEHALYDESQIIIEKTSFDDVTAYQDKDKYACLIKSTPVLTKDDIFKGMFCVAASCRYPERALMVLSELYNNVDLHTTLQYGSQEFTYDLITKEDGTKVVRRKENALDYSIDPRYTGNICKLYVYDEFVTTETDPAKIQEAKAAFYSLTNGVVISREYLDLVYSQNQDAKYSATN